MKNDIGVMLFLLAVGLVVVFCFFVEILKVAALIKWVFS